MTEEQQQFIEKLSGSQMLKVQKLKDWSPEEAKEYWDYWAEKHLPLDKVAQYWNL